MHELEENVDRRGSCGIAHRKMSVGCEGYLIEGLPVPDAIHGFYRGRMRLTIELLD